MEQVVALLKREHRLKVEICSLNLGPSPPEALAKNLERHDQIIAEINALRQNELVPIFRELTQFIKAAQDLDRRQQAARAKG
jgi:hypothetical protein